MNFDDTFCTVEFKNSQEKKEVSLSILGHDVIDFLEHYGEESLVGKQFYGIIGEGDGETKFLKLLKYVMNKRYPSILMLCKQLVKFQLMLKN